MATVNEAVAGAVLALAMVAAHADATLDKIRSRGSVSVGVVLGGAPYGDVDGHSGQPQGFNVDLARSVAQHLGVKLDLVVVTPANRVQFLQTGKVDLLLANMQWTQDRAEILSFVPTQYDESGGAAMVRKGSGIKRWEDLRGKPVCLSQGSNFAKPLLEKYGAQLKALPSMPEALLALKGGACVASVHISSGIHRLLETEADWKDYESPIASDLIPSPGVIWVRRGEKDTVSALDRIVKQWHGSGWLIQTARKEHLTVPPVIYALHDKFATTAR
ncbi:transporter substrate-binding domain-containing protein [Paludibacterium yongneupense]|uniref:transporter substrate-binding domain-containing protein n=1 Tax=Paludibacterium yongneupense TaxID=400061 RepID=UPI0004240D3A|nr:transporter substrate-binding domain-containing protein [Paludibacterium yongneupense]